MKKIFLVAIAAVLGLTACKKDDEVTLSNLEILQAHKWVCNAGTKTRGDLVTDLFATDNCEDDDIYDFKSDMNLTVNTGVKECYTNQDATFTLKYSLNDNKDTLLIETFPAIALKSFDKEKMVWGIVYPDADLGDLVISLEYVRVD